MVPDRVPSFLEFAAGADQAVLAEPGKLWTVQLVTDGTNAAEATVYDGPAASAKVIGHVKCAGADQFRQAQTFGVAATTSIHVTVTGTGAKAGLYYSK